VTIPSCDNLEPLTSWIDKPEEKGQCKSCALSGLIPEYCDVLAEFNQVPDIREKIEAALEDSNDPIGKVAQVLDGAKEAVDDEVKARLQALDCEAINYEGRYEDDSSS